MTAWEARRRVEEVRAYAAMGDDESAHIREDDLREVVLLTVFNDSRSPAWLRELAEIALSTKDIKFGRWCA